MMTGPIEINVLRECTPISTGSLYHIYSYCERTVREPVSFSLVIVKTISGNERGLARRCGQTCSYLVDSRRGRSLRAVPRLVL